MEGKDFRKRKAEFIKKWSDLISDLADGIPGLSDDMDLGVGLDMAVHMAKLAYDKQDYSEIIKRAEMPFDIEELIKDAMELYPRRFL